MSDEQHKSTEAQRKAFDNRLSPRASTSPDIAKVLDVPVRLSLEVGGAEMSIRQLIELQQGEVVELDREAGQALDVLVNGKLIARGEVVVVENRLAVRLTDVLSPSERLQTLG
ncbi:flagellar motor switch protein FliN [Spongiibacter sp. KMU-158]|uniref:Flagellar motor switch protein FliN n=1 Tax=Spongiibacter pelagi TaxID=2760804 RepID=A0A927C0I5_9GAMM|nr:flagellar motor switch protein FliN [Spongiibacter pelagi]MBD2859019.1 flagellar motor switch protein FliN [Spongiibacter pelagi]